MAINKKLIHFNTFENFNSKKLSANAENTLYTVGINGSILTGSPDILYQSIVYIKDTKQQWTHGLLYNCSDSESLLKTYTFYLEYNYLEYTITQEELEKIQNADIVYFYDEPNNIQLTVKEDNNGDISFLGYHLGLYPDIVKIYSITISQTLLVIMTLDSISLSDYISDYISGSTGEDQSSYIAAVCEEIVDGAYIEIVENSEVLETRKPLILILTDSNLENICYLFGPYITATQETLLCKFIGEYNDLTIECVIDPLSGFWLGTLHIKSKSEGGGGDLSNYPTKTSDLENDSGFITINDIPEVTVPTKTSELTNDSGFITINDVPVLEIPEEYVTETELNDKGFLTEHQDISHLATKNELAKVATTGSYNDLTDTPTIPTQVTESIVSGWGFTKNTGTYSKPSGGIPKNDLSSELQISLGKADTALQTETYKGTITGVSANGTSISTSGVANIPAASTSAYGVTKLSSSTSSTSTTLAATASAVKSAYDLANGKQDKLVSGTNIKTINGTSILGSGDIVISGGGSSSSGSGAYSQINHGTSDTTFTLTPNTLHVWDNVDSLTLTIGDEITSVANEYLFQFTSGSEPTTLILPDSIKFNSDFTVEANKIYQISILNGLGTVMSWEFTPNVVLITFYYSSSPFYAEKGMTWEQWCNSIYNTTMLKISGGLLTVNGLYPISNSSGLQVYGTDVIIENENYDVAQSGGGA